MTTLVSWAGVDSRGPASLYITSDSRISGSGWGTWDYGQKVFALPGSADAIGYSGDVALAATVLSQLASFIGAGTLVLPPDPDQRFQAVAQFIRRGVDSVQAPSGSTGAPPMARFVYAFRCGSGMGASFHAFDMEWKSNRQWNDIPLPMPTKESGLMSAHGSGGDDARQSVERWMNADVSGRTSRSVFSGFCDSLVVGRDPHSGGAPQLIGICRVGVAQNIGVIWNGRRYLHGAEVEDPRTVSNLRWVNDLFENCDSVTMQRLEGAQWQARPKALRR